LDKKAIENLKKQSERMERNKSRKIFEELKHENELDMVPTREKESAKKGTVPRKY
jgi:hypothetical protein